MVRISRLDILTVSGVCMYVVIPVVITDVLDVVVRYFVCMSGGPITFGRFDFGGAFGTLA